ncbi:hypothetical protein K2173_000324 [Erythroxylum novogranatense]|uniref:RING-type domain-containing protein n=1 Tax=Erythroxylum novogranatense TaxID=1862640 RepID=A0AAV8SWV0_9ROSI|nr:hypothetical protein K2173_000324 [Erythroxylum novogranatense]
MASFQVEIASSSPFGCVLQDKNRRNRCGGRETNAAFQRNLKELVRDHLHTCISVSSNENSENGINPKPDHGNLRYVTNGQARNVNGIGDSPAMSRKQARNVDRWAAKQAREMVSTIEKQSQEAELWVVASSNGQSFARESSQNTSDSSTQCGNSSESQNLGASSLVQIWEARLSQPDVKLNRSNSISSTLNPTCPSTNRTSFESNFTESTLPSPPRCSDAGDSASNVDSFADCDTIPQSRHSSMNSRISSAGEREKVRIADIIKKLTSDSNDQGQTINAGDAPRERRTCAGSESAEQRGFSQVVSSPRIRGRQAFNDLLLHMEQDRHRELNSLTERQSVSKFPHRGRIQSLLRLRFLRRRDDMVQSQQRPQITRTAPTSEANQLQQRSKIMHLREIFSAGIEQAMTSMSEAASTSRTNNDVKNVHVNNSSSTQKQPTTDGDHREAPEAKHSVPQVELPPRQTLNDRPQCSTTTYQSASQVKNLSSHVNQVPEKGHQHEYCAAQVENRLPPTQDHCADGHHQESSTTEQQVADLVENSTSKSLEDVHVRINITWQEIRPKEVEDLEPGEASQVTESLNEWDENETEQDFNYQQDFEVTSYDWFTDIARPKSYWEDRRQAWYQEMMLTCSDNDERRQLIERKTVSTFLAGDLRDKMDELMMLRAQRQASLEELDEGSEAEELLRLPYFRRHLNVAGSETEGREQVADYVGREVEGEEDGLLQEETTGEGGGESSSSQYIGKSPIDQYIEASAYFDETSATIQSSSPFGMWNHNDHHEAAVDDDGQVSSAPSLLSVPSQALTQDRPHSSSASHPSIEMEMIYDLRGHMEQLQSELFELKKSVLSCVDMQVKLANCMQHIAHPPVQVEGRNSIEKVPSKRICCICYEVQVDCFLYRCGHMCTCLKCAHELQWSSGKCPICRAPILDVVRADMDT